MKLENNLLELKGIFLKNDTYINSLKPNLDKLYQNSEYTALTNDSVINIEGSVISREDILPSNITYKTNSKEYINDEIMQVERVTEQLKILMPSNSIIKLISVNNDSLVKYNYIINILVKEPKEFLI
ncbi:MAG: hypothetical protein U5L45_22450 [Saprospiraceae bacterium]|nr:hypothetical protein [Saprospiraceae bacterium]